MRMKIDINFCNAQSKRTSASLPYFDGSRSLWNGEQFILKEELKQKEIHQFQSLITKNFMMDNSESKSRDGRQNGNMDGSSISSKKNSSDKRKVKYIVESIICTPQLFDNPYDQEENATKDLFQSASIKNIKKKEGYFEIEFNEKMINQSEGEEQKFEPEQIGDQELKNQLHKGKEGLQRLMPRFLDRVQTPQEKEKSIIQYKKLLEEKVEGAKLKKNSEAFFIFYFPVKKNKTPMKYLVLSDELVNLLGFTQSQFFIEGCQYGFESLQLYSGPAYVQMFLNLMNTMRKYISRELFNDIDYEEIVQQSEIRIASEMKGKKIIKVEMKGCVTNYDLSFYEIENVVDQKISDYRNAKNMMKAESYDNNLHLTYRSLHKFVKLPGFMVPSNLSKICGFKEIIEKHDEIKIEQGQRDQKENKESTNSTS